MRRLLLAMVGLVIAGLGVVRLAELTMSRDTPVDRDSRMAVVAKVHTKGHTPYSELQMARALFLSCRLEVDTNLISDAFDVVGPGEFRFVIRPALDESDRRQLHGCLEDARVDQLQVEVLDIERLPPRPRAARVA